MVVEYYTHTYTHELIRCIGYENVITESETLKLWIKPCIWFNVNEKSKTNFKMWIPWRRKLKRISNKIECVPFMQSSIWKIDRVFIYAWNIVCTQKDEIIDFIIWEFLYRLLNVCLYVFFCISFLDSTQIICIMNIRVHWMNTIHK